MATYLKVWFRWFWCPVQPFQLTLFLKETGRELEFVRRLSLFSLFRDANRFFVRCRMFQRSTGGTLKIPNTSTWSPGETRRCSCGFPFKRCRSKCWAFERDGFWRNGNDVYHSLYIIHLCVYIYIYMVQRCQSPPSPNGQVYTYHGTI